jgi:nitroreductase
MPEGVYLYEALPHRLTPVAARDFRKLASWNGSTDGPIHVFYVADLTRFDLGKDQPDPSIGDPEVQKSYYYLDTGLIAQNVHLFAASRGLAAWFHNCDKNKTARAFNLRPEQRVLFAQSIGYPETSSPSH